jgi:hypothetical protein
MMSVMRGVLFIAIASLVVGAGCATYHDQLARSQAAFEQSKYEQSLGLLRDLERDMSHLSQPEQAQYAYIRGMSDFRMGYRSDARHWLALARAYDENSPGVLPADWKARIAEATTEMDQIVYEEGTSALTIVKRSGDDEKVKRDSAPLEKHESKPVEPPAD